MGTNLLGVCPYVIMFFIVLEAILFHLYYLHLSCIQSVKLPSISSAVNFWAMKCFSQAMFLATFALILLCAIRLLHIHFLSLNFYPIMTIFNI
jgi:hypothetical protein